MREILSGFLLILVSGALAPAQTIQYEAERERWQKIGEIFQAMDVHSGSVVADIGAGDGFLAVRLSPLVGGNGRVFAEDVDKKRLDGLRKRAADAHLGNIDFIEGSANDPRLPSAQFDAIVILNAYHEMPQYEEMLQHIRDALKPGGRLVIAEPSPDPGEDTRAQQTAKHHISADLVREEVARAGFTIMETREKYAELPGGKHYYSLVTARRGD